MLSSAESVCASSLPIKRRLEVQPLWVPEPVERGDTLHIRFRAIVWGLLFSALLWGSFFLAVRALLSL
jgi:hypothetical protein